MIPELVRTWAAGWAASRSTPPPAERPWGCHLDVGRPDQVGRHVLPEAAESAVRAAAASVTVPHAWLKVPMDPDGIGPWLPAGWVVDKGEADRLTAADLAVTNPVPPAEHTASPETRSGAVHAQVRSPEGELAAQGQLAAGIPSAPATLWPHRGPSRPLRDLFARPLGTPP